jgi:hypothetical protein
MIIYGLTSVETTGLRIIRVLLEAWQSSKINCPPAKFECFAFVGVSHDLVRVRRVKNSDKKTILRSRREFAELGPHALAFT